MSGNRHTAVNDLSHHLKVEEENENEKNINNFINSQLNCVKISVSKLKKQKDEILKLRYFLEH